MATPAGPLEQWLGARGGGPVLRWAIDTLVGPTLDVLLVVVLAWLTVRAVDRALRRAVGRLRDPSSTGPAGLGRLLDGGGATTEASPRRVQRAEALAALARSAVAAAVWSIAALVALGTLGVELAPLLAGAGVVGVALGFGAQNVVRDLLAGVSMLVEDQYGVGDVIDVGEAVGVVEGVSLRSTRVRSVDGTLWHVPNGEIRRVGNRTQGFSRAILDVPLGNDADVDAALACLRTLGEGIAADPSLAPLLLGPPEVVGVEALTAEGMTVRLTVRTVPGEQWRVERALRLRVRDALAVGGIALPRRHAPERDDGARD